MELRRFFINDVGRLRSGWRLLLFVFAFLVISFLLATGLRILYGIGHQYFPTASLGTFIADVIYRLMLLFSALAAGYLCTRLLEGLPWRALGLAFHAGWLRDLLIGSVVGIASLALAAAIATAAGGLRFSASSTEMFLEVGKTLLSSALLFIIAGLAEEAMFRGYPLQTLSRARLALLGAFLTSVPFAAVHLWNPNAGPRAFANTALAGIWLSVAYLRTRSLWFPLGIHWAWNWALGSLFGLPVSGLKIVSYPLLEGKDLGPAWLTGGNYGIEGGVACTVALLLSISFIWRTRFVSATEEMKKLTSEENPAIPADSVGHSSSTSLEY
jgi:membrane protease YdiL (CAAX protease family)